MISASLTEAVIPISVRVTRNDVEGRVSLLIVGGVVNEGYSDPTGVINSVS